MADDKQARTSTKYAAKKAATERIAAARAAQAKAARRRNVMVAGGSVLAVVLVVGLIVVVGLATKKSASGGGNPVVAASSTVTNGLASAAALTSQTPNLGTISGAPSRLTGAPLTGTANKPQVLYVGAEYCPYCAATRWPLVVALSRFGSFSGLETTKSSSTDQSGPNTPTISFRSSTYKSDYVDFVPVEAQDGNGKALQQLTAAQESLFANVGKSSYPFIDFGGSWLQSGTSFPPSVLAGMSPDQVGTAIADPTTKPGAAVSAGADTFTSMICGLDGGKPASVCTAPGVIAATTALAAIK